MIYSWEVDLKTKENIQPSLWETSFDYHRMPDLNQTIAPSPDPEFFILNPKDED